MPTYRKRWRKYARKRGAILAVVDSSVLISALINRRGHAARILRHLGRCRFWLVTSPPLLREFEQVLGRNWLREKYGFTEAGIRKVRNLLRAHAAVVQIVGVPLGCRDPSDDMVLETAIRGRATHLVTRDDDIKDDPTLVGTLRTLGVEVISVSRFLKLLGR